MPTYGYECLACQNQFETFQSIKDAPLTTCESCGGSLRKRVYPVGIAFKGSGFYVNDYAAKPATPSSEGSSPSEAKSETKTEPAKTDAAKAEPAKAEPAKTETKSETKTVAPVPV